MDGQRALPCVVDFVLLLLGSSSGRQLPLVSAFEMYGVCAMKPRTCLFFMSFRQNRFQSPTLAEKGFARRFSHSFKERNTEDRYVPLLLQLAGCLPRFPFALLSTLFQSDHLNSVAATLMWQGACRGV